MNEIGSEFHKISPDLGSGIKYPRPGALVFSGRTAIEVVLSNLPNIQSALLPSYCCASMIIPFKMAGIDVKYFDVNWNGKLQVEINDSADILFWCNYFGFKNDFYTFDGVIIEDITHSLFSSVSFHSQSDYLVASLRKWEPIYCGGYCSTKFVGKTPPREFTLHKNVAMELKKEYLKDFDDRKKTEYLKIFSESNQWLSENFSGLSIDYWSREYLKTVDVEKQRKIRIENAKILYEGLKGKVQFMFQIEDMDCPLFVPVLLENRNKVREYLTKNAIYCPVHWPRPDGCKSNIYDMELSLICDQRYGIEDMERIVTILKKVL